jgi:hypothetical protein
VNKEKFKLAHVEEALRATGGVVTAAASKLEQAYGSCAPATVRNYIKRYPSLQRIVADVIEQNLDLAEGVLLKAMANDNLTAAIFYLKTKGKARGYVERFEATGNDGGPIKLIVDAETVRAARQRNLELVAEVSRRLASGGVGDAAAGGAGEDPGPADAAGGGGI